jgi:hypothetical protein
MDLPRFLDLLENESLHFARLDQLNDPFEGLPSLPVLHWPDPFRRLLPQGDLLDSISTMLDQSDQAHKKSILFHRNTSYVSCWHMNEHESAAMWDLYSNRGIAIQSTFERLCGAFGEDSDTKIQIGQVAYHDYENDWVASLDLFGGAFNKRLSYEHEREIRALVRLYPPDDEWHEDMAERFATHPTGIPVPVNVRTLIQRVVVSSQQRPWFRALVPRLLKRYDLGELPCEVSSLSERPNLAQRRIGEFSA